jgi:hypothetical protein
VDLAPSSGITVNLLLSRPDWLVLKLDVSPRRVGLLAVARLRWEDDERRVIDAEPADDDETSHRGRRQKVDRLAVDRLAERWDDRDPAPTGPHDAELTRAGFHVARKLLDRGFLAQLAPAGRANFDVAVALAGEDMATILRRMDGRCGPESRIARLRTRCGVTLVELFHTEPA